MTNLLTKLNVIVCFYARKSRVRVIELNTNLLKNVYVNRYGNGIEKSAFLHPARRSKI